jgi:hypothetical protein
LNKASVQHTNSGTLALGANNFTIVQSGTSPSFATSGPLTVGAGRALSITGAGAFTYSAGALNGTGLVSLQNTTVGAFTPNFTVGPLGLEVVDATLGGAGIVTVANGATLLLRRATMNSTLVNQGTVQAEYLTAFQAPLTQSGTLIVTSDNFGNSAAVTAPGFSNFGTIQLTGSGTGTFTTSGT